MSRQRVGIGHAVEAYPNSAWSRIPASIKLEDIWEIVGPQVEMHMNKLPLWKVFCAVYFEGLAHGVAGEQRRVEALARSQATEKPDA